MPGRAHREREAAAGEPNLERLFDREFLDALRTVAAAPSDRAMLANFVGRVLTDGDVCGIGLHPSPTSSDSTTDSVAIIATASRTSELNSLPPFAT